MSKKHINPSGFTENLPQEQIVEEILKEKFKVAALRYGYVHLETTSVEYMDTLVSEGNVNKEIYKIVRSQEEGDGNESERGLHFDLTIPFARYTAQNYGSLRFPFRRYQIQKVWRGERPQKGRFREFYQADIDVVGNENLPIQFDSEVITVMASILSSLNIGTITMKINNRKFLTGLLQSYHIKNSDHVLQLIDKLDKIGEKSVKEKIIEIESITSAELDAMFALLAKKITVNELPTYLKSIPDNNNLLEEGKAELASVLENLPKSNSSGFENIRFVFDPSIARGLDYYTGTVCETTIDGYENYGSVCSGGRYADLANRFINKKLPGVGLSIGLTRLLSLVKEEGLIDFSKKTNALVSMYILDEVRRVFTNKTADALRAVNINVELQHKVNTDLNKQIAATSDAGIKFMLTCEADSTFTLYNTITNDKTKYDTVSSLKKALKAK